MRIVYVQTYPVYHDQPSTEAWLRLENRDRWMPALTAGLGHDVELWGVDRAPGAYPSAHDGIGAPYTVRLFAQSHTSARTKFDYSDALVQYAREHPADLYVLKGTDGGVGERLIKKHLLPQRRPFAFIIGGTYYTAQVPKAAAVLYETEFQRDQLSRPGKRFWRQPVDQERLIRLPKSVDTDRFRPMPEVEKTWDVVSVGRLLSHYKNYDALGALSERFSVAVIGGGPAEEALRRKYPKIHWIGQKPNADLPKWLNRGRIFMHAGLRDYFPRVLGEAAACGLPCVAFGRAIAPDVLPSARGLRLGSSEVPGEIGALLQDTARLNAMAVSARAYAEREGGRASSLPAINAMLERI